MARFRSGILPVLSTTLALSGCAGHDVYSFSFRKAEVKIGDRGIAVPVPPPSLELAPVQPSNIHVDYDVDVVMDDQPEDAALPSPRLVARDLVGGSEADTLVEIGSGSALIPDLTIDHTNNCLALWVELPGGEASDPIYYHSVILDDETVVAMDGCAPALTR